MPDFLFGIEPGHNVVYDIETFPNAFTLTARDAVTGRRWVFEASDRRNDLPLLRLWMDALAKSRCKLVGFNNLGFDYPVIHFIYNYVYCTVPDIYDKAMSIINTPFTNRFAHLVWDSEQVVPQIDLYKMHHFDNVSKATSLKVLEFNMRMDSVEDLPFPVGTVLTGDQIDVLEEYNYHDVVATDDFLKLSQPALKLREDLSNKFKRNMRNMSDVKVGETLLIMEMEKHGVSCYTTVDGRKQKKQTIRKSLALADVIFPYVSLENSEFRRIHQWLAAQTITETKGVFKDLKASVNGIDYNFGTGGLHASIHQTVVRSNETHQLVDVDVSSFYPNLGIKNGLYPAHLGPAFCFAYLGVYETRKTYKKKTAENEAYKLALNGAYGGSNNKFSPFYDTAYTMSITINGQLLLCMLIEQMLKIPGLSMVQCNTDGITYLCPREYLEHSREVCRWWEGVTRLELEEALYTRMFIRDVNSYIAEYKDGNLKRIGAYAYVTAIENPGTRELPHHKDWSARVVAKAAEAALVRGTDIREFIENHEDVYDFLLRTKVPRSASLEWGGEKMPNIIRYYLSTDGDFLEKVMPPRGKSGQFCKANGVSESTYLDVIDEIGEDVWDARIHTKNRSTYGERRTGIHTGSTVMICNNMQGHDFGDIDYNWYVTEAEKLVLPLIG